MTKQILTQERLQELLHYSVITGLFYRRVKVNRNTVIGRVAGSQRHDGYHPLQVDGKKYLTHRLAFLYVLGEMPKEVDHINQDPACSAWHNIRSVTRSENSKNQKIRSDNTSGHLGVAFDNRLKKWMAQIFVNGTHIHIGVFKNKDEAISARKLADKKYGFHKNHGRKL